MKTRLLLTLLSALAAGAIGLSGTAVAQGQGGGGKGGGTQEPPDYGDLFILYRDVWGVPFLTEDDCQQPLAAEPFEGCIQKPGTTDPADCLIIPVDPATCSVEGPYAIYTQEVDFGRINEARSPAAVFETQLEEATLTLATAGCVSLDPAGRPVASSLIVGDNPETPDVEEEYVKTSTIDSPLQHLAIYQKLMEEGTLGPNVDLKRPWIDAAATSLGGASDKSGFVGVDLVVYLNEILGLTDDAANSMLGRKCISVKEEVMGVIQHVQKCFLDYSTYNDGNGYWYYRWNTFSALPTPPYIFTSTDPDGEGIFEYLGIYDIGSLLFTIVKGPILDAVPKLSADQTYFGENIGAFAEAADDSRAVIDFFHAWPVPAEFATPVPCDVAPDMYYDVSISADSGLQVPKRMVAGTEGREGTLTVSTAGPADANGVVRLTGVDSDGAFIGPLYLVEGGLPTETELFTAGNDYSEPFELVAGYSTSWTFYFSMDYDTTINWKAQAIAADDVNDSNDIVYEVTVVTPVRGGGGGGGGGGGNH